MPQQPRKARIAAIAAVGVVLATTVSPVTAAPLEQTGDSTPVQELAERLLVQPFGSFPGASGPSQIQAVQLLPGRTPSDLPVTLPLPAGGRLLGGAVRRSDDQVIGLDVVVESPQPPTDLTRFYEQALSEQGWSVPSTGPRPTGGFQTAPFSGSTFFCQPAGTGTLTLTTFASGPGRSTVRATFNPTTYGPCGLPPQPPATVGPPPDDLLPVLTTPPGVVLQQSPGGGFYSSYGAASNATAETERTAAELEAAFVQQLQAAGWIRQTGGGDGPLAWSTWNLPREGDWHGLLFVLETPGTNRRFLYVRAESTGGPLGPFGPLGGTSVIVPAPGFVPPPPPSVPLSAPAPPGALPSAPPSPTSTPTP